MSGFVCLLQIDLPVHTVRLCDAGFVYFGGQLFTGQDPLFGTIGGVETPAEGAGDEVPAASLTFLPIVANLSPLTAPGSQGSRVRFWVSAYDEANGALVGTADLQFDGQVDQITVAGGKQREVRMTIVSTAERLFEGNLGNAMSGTWHKSVWPGELGHDNATGLSVPVAWGIERTSGVSVSAVNKGSFSYGGYPSEMSSR